MLTFSMTNEIHSTPTEQIAWIKGLFYNNFLYSPLHEPISKILSVVLRNKLTIVVFFPNDVEYKGKFNFPIGVSSLAKSN